MKTLLAAALLFVSLPVHAAFVWVEGEAHTEAETHSNPWWEGVRKTGLSGGDYVTSFSEPEQSLGRAEYTVEVPEDGTYKLWIRGAGNGLAYALDGSERTVIDPRALSRLDNENRRNEDWVDRFQDSRNLALDGGTDARYYAWMRVGEHEMSAGEHSLTLFLGDPDAEKPFGAVDCFVLTTEDFEPNGQYKPGQRNPNLLSYEASRMWSFEPEPDPLSDEALLDLRHLNEDVAGQSGFVRLSEDGKGFVRGDGEPLRFWAGTDYNQRNLDLEALTRHAEFLAKRGINIVRWHGDLPDHPSRQERREGVTTKMTDVDEEALDEVFKLVAAMKEAGIYTILSPYWGSHTRIEENWEVRDPGGNNLAGLVFFLPEVQEAYKGYLRALYTRENPYTGIALKDEPAVAIIQLQNEDSMLFYTMSNVRGEAEKVLRRQFVDWLEQKYGSIEKTKEAWQNYTYDYRGKDWEDGLPAIMFTWEFSRDGIKSKEGQAGFLQRRADQLEFFAETMYTFNAEMERFIRDELGAPQLINAGNWKSVDPVVADDAERWSYTANDVVAKNHYFGALHTGRTRGWQILPDHIYNNKSAALEPRALPTNVRQVWGHPFIIPESLWVPPNKYESEGPLMVASQQALNGVDAFFWFANGAPEWEEAVQGNRNSSMPKWTYATPMQLGQFPAAAYLYRKGLVKQAEPVVIERRSMENIWDETLPITAESGAFDPNRDEGLMAEEVKLDSPIDPLVFLVGQVWVEYGADPADTFVDYGYRDFIDHDRQMVRSQTGEIEIHHGKGLYLVKAPAAQGAAGKLAEAGTIDLGDVHIDVKNAFGSVVAVALDDKALEDSGRILVQVGTFQRPKGFTAEEIQLEIDGEPTRAWRIIATGENPWQIERAYGTLKVRNDTLKKATVLDHNGMPRESIDLESDGGWTELELPEDALYVILSR
jgi:hypothetical protein